MNFYKLDYVIEETLKNDLSREQQILSEYVGAIFPKEEAVIIWEKVLDHKWYISERLSRDVGLRVAAVDFVENFYEPTVNKQKRRKMPNYVLSPTTFAA
jgi:hypothetical protein